VSRITAGSMSILYVNGSARITPITKPRPGMIDTSMPTSSPITSINRS